MHTKHTPGPWKIIILDGHTYINPLRPEGEWGLIAKIHGNSEHKKHKKEANAALIAAAPDLLAALIQWAEYAEQNGGDEAYSFYAATRAAIARANGGAP
jgi:hypothetical protein